MIVCVNVSPTVNSNAPPTPFVRKKTIPALAMRGMKEIHSPGVSISMNVGTMFVVLTAIVSIPRDRMSVNVELDIPVRHQTEGVLISMSVFPHHPVAPTRFVPIRSDPFNVLVKRDTRVPHPVSFAPISMNVSPDHHAAPMLHPATTLMDPTLVPVIRDTRIHHRLVDVSTLTNVLRVVTTAIRSMRYVKIPWDHSPVRARPGIKVLPVPVRM